MIPKVWILLGLILLVVACDQGADGDDGADGLNGSSCNARTLSDGVELICNGQVVDTLLSGVDGDDCAVFDSGLEISVTCGTKDSVQWAKYLCKGVAYDPFSQLCDSRDGRLYRKVKLGGRMWMAENLNYKVNESWCYGNNADSCAVYGRLYNWNAAMMVCPKGWYLPSQKEWQNLVDSIGGEETAGSQLKSSVGWLDSNKTHLDLLNFSALPSGYYDGEFTFAGVGRVSTWWSSTIVSGTHAWVVVIYADVDNITLIDTQGYIDDIYFGRSVRCVEEL